jgi:hypothetical protein
MRKKFLMYAGSLLFLASCWAQTKGKTEYKNRDGLRVVVVPVGKPSGHEAYESRIEFLTAEGKLLCSLDYSSEDGDHGFGIVKAAWTEDGRYFVFSLTSSGGHQGWHFPTHFYNTNDMKIYYLDDFVEASGISKGEFILKAPHVVLTEVQREKEVPVKFHLDKLVAKSQGLSRVMACSDAKELTPEQ